MMPALLSVVAALVALAALSFLHHAFWSWKLGVPPREDALLHVTAADGWSLAVGRNLPKGPARWPPVLLVHGIAMNRQTFEFGVESHALAPYLARAGFDCFTLDLRGHGDSRRRPSGASRRFTLDTYLEQDLPAALELVRRETGAGRVLYVGHSQGGMLGLAACGLYPERIAAIASLAGPVHFDVQERLKKLVKLRLLLRFRFTRLSSRMVAPFSGYWHPELAELAVHMRNVEPRIYRRVLANAMEDLHAGVLEQFATFIREDSFRSMDGKVDYRAGLSTSRQPALFVSAEKDGLAPPAAVESGFRRWGGPKELVSFEREYGHLDLIVGRKAPEVVFPVVRDFLLAQSAPFASADAEASRGG